MPGEEMYVIPTQKQKFPHLDYLPFWDYILNVIRPLTSDLMEGVIRFNC